MGSRSWTVKIFTMLLMIVSSISILPLGYSLSTVSLACAQCQQPTFPPGGRLLYLPHCVNGKSLNYCDAVCAKQKEDIMSQGSCENCEENVEWFFYLFAVKTKQFSY